MTIQSTGKISLSDINVELGLNSSSRISLGDSGVRGLLGKSSGPISLTDAYGKSNATYATSAVMVASNGGIMGSGYSIQVGVPAFGTMTPTLVTPSGYTVFFVAGLDGYGSWVGVWAPTPNVVNISHITINGTTIPLTYTWANTSNTPVEQWYALSNFYGYAVGSSYNITLS